MIRGENLALQAIKEEDLPKLFSWINTPQIVQWSASYRPVHFSNHREWFENIAKAQDKVIFAVSKNENDELIGMVQLIDINPAFQNAELVIRIAPEQERGKGYGQEATKIILDYAWNTLNLHRVWLRVFQDNSPAIKCYEACGFSYEGCMKDSAFINGSWKNIVIMGILK